MSVNLWHFENQLAEIDWLVKQVENQLNSGLVPEEIAIISPKHKYLENLVPFFLKKNIPISYIRENSVLQEPSIIALLDMAKLSYYITADVEIAQEYWPKVLTNPCWEISSETIWKLSLISHYSRQTWLETILTLENNITDKEHLKLDEAESFKLKQIANFFINISRLSQIESAERILNRLLGAEETRIIAEDETDQDAENELALKAKPLAEEFISPFKNYYFDEAKVTKETDYLWFLANLRVLVDQLRKMNSTTQILLPDWLNSLEILTKSRRPLISKLNIGDAKGAVNFLTAHSAKGLEFETVFLIHCNQEVWSSKTRASKLSLPKNLSLQQNSENADDKIRLFFVSLTRAKKNLFLSYSNQSIEGDTWDKLSFLDGINLVENEVKKDILELNKTWFTLEMNKQNLLTIPEADFLSPELHNYQLSVTHLNNFLNISEGGPQLFLNANLLRFPQAKTLKSTFGTLMHESVANFYKEFSSKKVLPEFDYLMDSFKILLSKQRLSLTEKKELLEMASIYLLNYYDTRKNEFNFSDKIEFNFKDQGVVIGEAKLTGKIDKMIMLEDDKKISVVDLKTGKPLTKWHEKGNTPEAQKTDKYRRQLVFYKILVENSREFKGKYSVDFGHLDFIQPEDETNKLYLLETPITNAEADELKLLIQKVWNRIMNKNFSIPDKKYSEGLKGTQEFIQDLLAE